jgi:4-alpha-glucanotransferase
VGRDCTAKLIQYEEIAELKVSCLQLLFATLNKQDNAVRQKAFEEFHKERPELLDRACAFQALRSHFAAQEPPLSNFEEWPEEYRSSQAGGIAPSSKSTENLFGFTCGCSGSRTPNFEMRRTMCRLADTPYIPRRAGE